MVKTDIKKNSVKSISKLCSKLNKTIIKYNGNAIIYSRVSTQNQKFGTSLEAQEELAKSYCIEKQYAILDCVHEVRSAKNLTNQEKLIDIINSNNNIQLIICEPTRLSRNLSDFTQLLTTCEEKNSKFFCNTIYQ